MPCPATQKTSRSSRRDTNVAPPSASWGANNEEAYQQYFARDVRKVSVAFRLELRTVSQWPTRKSEPTVPPVRSSAAAAISKGVRGGAKHDSRPSGVCGVAEDAFLLCSVVGRPRLFSSRQPATGHGRPRDREARIFGVFDRPRGSFWNGSARTWEKLSKSVESQVPPSTQREVFAVTLGSPRNWSESFSMPCAQHQCQYLS